MSNVEARAPTAGGSPQAQKCFTSSKYAQFSLIENRAQFKNSVDRVQLNRVQFNRVQFKNSANRLAFL